MKRSSTTLVIDMYQRVLVHIPYTNFLLNVCRMNKPNGVQPIHLVWLQTTHVHFTFPMGLDIVTADTLITVYHSNWQSDQSDLSGRQLVIGKHEQSYRMKIQTYKNSDFVQDRFCNLFLVSLLKSRLGS